MTTVELPTFKMGRVFHLVHVVDDLDEVRRWYTDVFDPLHVKRNDTVHRSGTFVVFADMILEAMAAPPGALPTTSAVAAFRKRFGQRMHSIAMFVDDLSALSLRLERCGLDVYDIDGKKVVGPAARDARWVWTHPKQTHGVFEFSTVPEYHYDPRLHRSYSGEYWRRAHPLSVIRTSHLTMLVDDLNVAEPIYATAFGGTFTRSVNVPDSHRSAFFTFGPDLEIEVRQPLDAGTPDGRQLAEVGGGCFGLTFEVVDLGEAVAHLKRLGQPIERLGPHHIMIPPSAAFGMGVAFYESPTGDRHD